MRKWTMPCIISWILLIVCAWSLFSFAQHFAPEINAPEIISVTANGDGAIVIKWSGVDFATSYRVFRRVPGEEYKLLKVVPNSTFSYTDSGAAGQGYEYAMRACNGSMGNLNLSGYSLPMSDVPNT